MSIVNPTTGRVDFPHKRIADELTKARAKFPGFRSAHEGYAILKEEVDELWDVIKAKGCTKERIAEEAIQVAAMAISFLIDMQDWNMP